MPTVGDQCKVCMQIPTCDLQRQKAAKTGAKAPTTEEHADDADTINSPLKASQSMAAHAPPMAHPGPAAAAASQYPFGVPLPGQGPPAAAPAHRQAAGSQGASRHTKLWPQCFTA